MEPHISKCHYTRASSKVADEWTTPSHDEVDAATDDSLTAQLNLATNWYAQGMSSTDWEIANRGIRRARDIATVAQRELALKGMNRELEQQLKTRCDQLLADADRAAVLLTVRIARVPDGGQAS